MATMDRVRDNQERNKIMVIIPQSFLSLVEKEVCHPYQLHTPPF